VNHDDREDDDDHDTRLFGGREPKLNSDALHRAAMALEQLADSDGVRDAALTALGLALKTMIGEDHAELRPAYDKLMDRTLDPAGMRQTAARLFTIADGERQGWGTREDAENETKAAVEEHP
jgi:hypothetical protein